MKPLSKPEPGPRAVRGPRRPDLAARVRGRARTLRAHLDTREALADAIRQANASLAPAAIALDNAVTLQRAEARSVTDDLTGLSNSRHLNGARRREARRAFCSGRPPSLLGLDGFKQVNDTHGHRAGSKALTEAARLIRGCARETDVVARFGGDESSLILADTSQGGALFVATRIRERLRSAQFLPSDGLCIRLTASTGVATLQGAAASAEELLKAADPTMYKVKAAGKDGIYTATAS